MIEVEKYIKEFRFAFDRTYTPGSKVAVYYHPHNYNDTVRVILQRIIPPKLLHDRFMMDCHAFVLYPLNFFFEILDRKLQQYIEGDLIDYNKRAHFKDSDPKKFEVHQESFAVLTLNELESGFAVSMLPLVFGVFLFIAEWIPRLKELIIVLYIFKTYFDVEHSHQSKNREFSIKQTKSDANNCDSLIQTSNSLNNSIQTT